MFFLEQSFFLILITLILKYKLQEEISQNTKEYEETKRQIEEDCDTEVIDVKTKHEKRLKEQIELNEKISSDAHNIRKRVSEFIFFI